MLGKRKTDFTVGFLEGVPILALRPSNRTRDRVSLLPCCAAGRLSGNLSLPSKVSLVALPCFLGFLAIVNTVLMKKV
ncbi:MAG: hypothetical protein VB056_10275 [Sphaerochaeta associata]|uniref:hypothetical protein n=1 Tax=Sphaerochaeta associata TaxID=1129264 RepID=UPI002B21475F|nr:hypothetical protein [Sphaerochaeta associata]MEA5029254.1 hypothetical protein [Sphaerochaeta associata]